MRALLSVMAGGPETLVLRELPEPSIGVGQVRIAVRNCGINYPDALIIEDKYQFRPPRPFAPGLEVSGVVEAVGQEVDALRVGDRVIATVPYGGLAEQLVADVDACMPMPDSMPFEVGAALVATYGTSYHALVNRGELQPGETLLVLGAAGGVGLAAVELGRALGANVIAAASSEAKVAVAREHGAHHTVVYPRDAVDQKSLAAMFKEVCGARGADVIYDPVGGDYAEPALRCVAWKGRYLVVGFPAGIPRLPLNLPLLKGCDIRGVFWGAARTQQPLQHQANMRALVALHASGKIRPRISARYPLAKGGEAIAKLLAREAVGKIVVDCSA